MSSVLAYLLNRVVLMMVVVAVAVPARAQEYSDAPPVLKKLIEDTASDIVADQDPSLVGSIWPQVVFYAVADGLTVNQKGRGVRDIPPYKYYVETARTDKQIGASPGSSGSTSVLEKPGAPSLIGLAMEHGAIDQTVSGTGVTLSTSPYALLKLMTPETQANFSRYSFWRRIGVSATFPLDDPQAASSAEAPVLPGSFDTKTISAWSLRLQVLGDRSARSSKADSLWEKDIQPLIQKRLDTMVEGMRTVLNADARLQSRSDSLRSALVRQVDEYLNTSAAEADSVRKQTVVRMILAEAKNGIFEPLKNEDISVDPAVKKMVVEDYVPSLLATHEAMRVQMQERVEAMAEAINKAPILTLGYTNHLTEINPDHSDVKLLFEGFLDPFNVILNAGVGFYHSPVDSLNQSTLRDFNVGVSLEGEFDNLIMPDIVSGDLGKITFALTARYRRLKEVDDNIAVVQARLDIPLKNGLSLPLSITYANRTELIDESEVRGNFGITFDLDKLFALSQGPPRF